MAGILTTTTVTALVTGTDDVCLAVNGRSVMRSSA
jgi:hypothetical protein